jgi:hypothetical protein
MKSTKMTENDLIDKKLGRPKKDNTVTKQVKIYFTIEEHKKLLSKADGIPLSTFIRIFISKILQD